MQSTTSLHTSIEQKLEGFYRNNRIPNLLFHGGNGTGKRTLVYNFIHRIYDNEKAKIKANVMFVNCAHGKGIKFIREELKFFAKTNIKGNSTRFKTIVLFHADSLTIDAQSALRRCIELFSYNTRFFIVVENKHRLLNPIVSRFCEIYVPEVQSVLLQRDGQSVNLHWHRLMQIYGGVPRYNDNNSKKQWWSSQNIDHVSSPARLLEVVHDAYELGLSALDLVDWIRDELGRIDIVMNFHTIRLEYRCEKMLMFCILEKIARASSRNEAPIIGPTPCIIQEAHL
jgi:hypothetical protein